MSFGDTDGSGQSLDSDGNRVNVGKFDADGLNVNNYNDDNVNDNLGVSSSRQSSPSCKLPQIVGACAIGLSST